MSFSSQIYWFMAEVSLVKLTSDEHHWALLIISQHIGPWEILVNFRWVIFKLIYVTDGLSSYVTGPYWQWDTPNIRKHWHIFPIYSPLISPSPNRHIRHFIITAGDSSQSSSRLVSNTQILHEIMLDRLSNVARSDWTKFLASTSMADKKWLCSIASFFENKTRCVSIFYQIKYQNCCISSK